MFELQDGVSQGDDGTPVRTGHLGNYTVQLELSEQVLGLDILEEIKFGGGQDNLARLSGRIVREFTGEPFEERFLSRKTCGS